MKTYLVQLESHDDVVSARDKISWSKARRILLVWPRKGKIMERRLDLLLLQRHAQKNGAQIAIVTRSSEVRTHARDLGIPVFAKTAQAQQALWRRARRRRLARPNGRPSQPQLLRQQRNVFAANTALALPVRLLAFSAGVLAFLALVLLFLPAAEVQLKLEREPQRLTIPAWASPQIPAPNPSGGMPAQVVSAVVEGRDQATATGSTRAPDRPATGEVQLTNLTDRPLEVPAGSVVITHTDPPLRYVLTETVRLPEGPGTQGLAPIEAVYPGRAGNVAAGRITAMEGPLGLNLAVENITAVQGGSDRVSPAPTEGDYRALRNKLLASLEDTARDELLGRVRPGERLLVETLRLNEVLEESADPDENQPGDRLQLAMRVEYQALVISEEDLQVVAQSALDANLASGFRPVPGSLQVEFSGPLEVAYDEASGDAGGGRQWQARWNLRVERFLEVDWSHDALVQAIKGRSIEEASEILAARLPLAEPPRFEIFPAWWVRLPYLPFRITLVES